MPYVKRDSTGQIVSVHDSAQDESCVEVDDDDEEFRAFLARTFGSLENLSRFERLDQEFIRVIEDVIYLLIERRIFLLTDLPEAAQQKLAERRNLRGKEGDLGAIVATGEDLMLP